MGRMTLPPATKNTLKGVAAAATYGGNVEMRPEPCQEILTAEIHRLHLRLGRKTSKGCRER